ncbi:hypothetical protein ACYSNO_10585 [Enterococcus sp. LJL98]
MEKEIWHGLPEERFKTYRHWITPKGYLCGTYASIVLLAYYQDFIDESLIPAFIRRKNSREVQPLASFLQLFIQRQGLPTVAWQVAHGLSRFFHYQQNPLRGRATMLGGWQRVVKRIDQGKPVIVGVNRLLGSTYGNHWLVAYAYLETPSGKRYLKVHDNWGNHAAVIPMRWVNGTVSLP